MSSHLSTYYIYLTPFILLEVSAVDEKGNTAPPFTITVTEAGTEIGTGSSSNAATIAAAVSVVGVFIAGTIFGVRKYSRCNPHQGSTPSSTDANKAKGMHVELSTPSSPNENQTEEIYLQPGTHSKVTKGYSLPQSSANIWNLIVQKLTLIWNYCRGNY